MNARRQLLHAALCAGAALLAGRRSFAAATAVQTREVSGFHEIDWTGAGELTLEQTGREQLTVEAEPLVLAKMITEVRGGRLSIGFAPGNLVAREPIRIRIELKALTAVSAQGSGTLRIGRLSTPALLLQLDGSQTMNLAWLDARSLDVQLGGAGTCAIDGGHVERQHIAIAGSANYSAPRLASRAANVVIDGSGSALLAVADQLEVTLSGSGNVRYAGDPRVTQSISGSGRVERGAGAMR